MGFDIDKKAISIARNAELKVKRRSIQQIVEKGTFGTQETMRFSKNPSAKSAVTLLNMLHHGDSLLEYRQKLLAIMLKEFDFVVITATRKQLKQIRKTYQIDIEFVSNIVQPITKTRSVLEQYGTTFIFKKGRIRHIETKFWEIFMGKYLFPNPIQAYTRLVAVLILKKLNA